MTNTDTREAILTAARLMVQARGYNALSFRDVAKAVEIKSASVHYHFPTKGDLGSELARRYTEDAIEYFDGLLAASADPRVYMQGYTDVFRAALLKDNRMCLCGIMAAEHDDLPPEVRAEVDRFGEVNVAFLSRVLSMHSPRAQPDLRRAAVAVYAAVEGAQLVARGRGDKSVYDETIDAYRAAGLFP